MMKILCYAGILICILGILVIAEMIREYHTFRVTDYDITSNKLQGLKGEKRIVLLSDLHNRVYGSDNQKLLEAVRDAKPDLILIAGDMLVGKPEVPWDAAYDFVKQLPEICPVYYGNGNHEYRMKIYPEKFGTAIEEYRAALKGAGVHFLENESENVQLDQCNLRISGLEIPKRFYSKFRKQHMEKLDVENCIGRAAEDAFQILIAHNPTYFYAYKDWGADLVLSGHLHGGVVRIPGIGGVISTQFDIFPKYSGELTKEDDVYIAVSKGIGTHSINLRLFNLPEIVVLHLNTCENVENPV